MLRHVLLQNVILDRSLQLVDRHPLTLRRRDVEAEQHRGGTIDRHRGGHAIERDPVEERLHVGKTRDGDATLADLAFRPGMIRVVAHERWKIERDREPGLPALQEELVSLVRVLGGAEARELAHRPETPAIHGRMDAAGIRVLARELDATFVVDPANRAECKPVPPRAPIPS